MTPAEFVAQVRAIMDSSRAPSPAAKLDRIRDALEQFETPVEVAKPQVSANSRSVANDPVAATPDQQPTVQPTVEQIADAIHDDEPCYCDLDALNAAARAVLALIPGRTEAAVKAEALRDEYHTMDELYEYRMLYNALAANWLPQEWVSKSWRHSDGEECFGGGWFVVYAILPTGQVSNHYKAEHWGLFDIPEVERAPEYDGHTPQVAAQRLAAYLNSMTGATP